MGREASLLGKMRFRSARLYPYGPLGIAKDGPQSCPSATARQRLHRLPTGVVQVQFSLEREGRDGITHRNRELIAPDRPRVRVSVGKTRRPVHQG